MNHKQEIGVGVFFLALAGAYFAGSMSISTFDPFGNSALSSRSIPQMISLFAAMLSVIHITDHALKMTKEKSDGSGNAQSEGGFKTGSAQRRMLLTILLFAAYIFFFTRLGFLLSSFLFLLAEIFLLLPREKRRKWAAFTVCFSAALPALLYILFTKALSMFLPRGVFGW